METNEKSQMRLSFAALDPYIERNIVLPTETLLRGKDMVQWGDRNIYPDYLLGLTKNAPTLRAVINGTIDFILGNEQTILPLPGTGLKDGIMNTRGDTIRMQVEDLARDYETYGGFALQVIRSKSGQVAELYHCPMRFLRSNKENSVFYYSEEWDKFRQKAIVYPAFIPGLEKKWATLDEVARKAAASSILYVKNDRSQVYPLPPYCAAVKACETERCIAEFHLNSINNGFFASAIINFNNGVPTDAIKEQVEKDLAEKFSGASNAGRMVVSWNDNKEAATTIVPIKSDDFSERYKSLAASVRQQIFTAFQCSPNLVGVATDNNGFANEEYEEAFKLYNRTHVIPVQDKIKEAYNTIYGGNSGFEITPFSLGENDTTETLAAQLGVGGTQALMAVLESTTLTIDQKKGTLKVLFGMDDEAVSAVLGIPYVPTIED